MEIYVVSKSKMASFEKEASDIEELLKKKEQLNYSFMFLLL